RMMLENASNQEKIKSLPGEKIPGLGENLSRTDPFKVEEADIAIFTLDPKTQREREILGPDFVNEYRAFLDHYSKTTSTNENWHYVAAATGKEHVLQADKEQKPIIDKEQF